MLTDSNRAMSDEVESNAVASNQRVVQSFPIPQGLGNEAMNVSMHMMN